MLRELNKESITFVVKHDFTFSDAELDEIAEAIWNSDDILQDIQSAEQRIRPDFAKNRQTG